MLTLYVFLKEVHLVSENLGVYVCEMNATSSAVPLFLVYTKYTDVFREDADTILLPHCEELNYVINLKSEDNALFSLLYNLLEYELGVFKNYLNKNLKSEFITWFKSPAGALILFIKKKDSSLRLCVNYWGLNAVIIKDKYLIPLISEILDCLSWAQVFTKLDLQGAYNLIRIKKGDKWKTMFWTYYSSFEFRIMSFDLVNALFIF